MVTKTTRNKTGLPVLPASKHRRRATSVPVLPSVAPASDSNDSTQAAEILSALARSRSYEDDLITDPSAERGEEVLARRSRGEEIYGEDSRRQATLGSQADRMSEYRTLLMEDGEDSAEVRLAVVASIVKDRNTLSASVKALLLKEIAAMAAIDHAGNSIKSLVALAGSIDFHAQRMVVSDVFSIAMLKLMADNAGLPSPVVENIVATRVQRVFGPPQPKILQHLQPTSGTRLRQSSSSRVPASRSPASPGVVSQGPYGDFVE